MTCSSEAAIDKLMPHLKPHAVAGSLNRQDIGRQRDMPPNGVLKKATLKGQNMGEYRKWLESELPVGVIMTRDLHYLLELSGVKSKESKYEHLASLNAKIVRMGEMIERQKMLVLELKDEQYLEVAVDVLQTLQETERLLLSRRSDLLKDLRRFPLPPRTEEELQSMNGNGGHEHVSKGEKKWKDVCNGCGSNHCVCESEFES